MTTASTASSTLVTLAGHREREDGQFIRGDGSRPANAVPRAACDATTKSWSWSSLRTMRLCGRRTGAQCCSGTQARAAMHFTAARAARRGSTARMGTNTHASCILARPPRADKNPDRKEEAEARFIEVQAAYDVLSDSHERSWCAARQPRRGPPPLPRCAAAASQLATHVRAGTTGTAMPSCAGAARRRRPTRMPRAGRPPTSPTCSPSSPRRASPATATAPRRAAPGRPPRGRRRALGQARRAAEQRREALGVTCVV